MRLWFLLCMSEAMKPDVVVRYFRIQGTTNPLFKEVYSHTAGKVVSGFVSDPILQDTVYEFVTDTTHEVSRLDLSMDLAKVDLSVDPAKSILETKVGKQLTYFVQHLVIQTISHEISDCIHHTLK